MVGVLSVVGVVPLPGIALIRPLWDDRLPKLTLHNPIEPGRLVGPVADEAWGEGKCTGGHVSPLPGAE
jgi:hypothetical protein